MVLAQPQAAPAQAEPATTKSRTSTKSRSSRSTRSSGRRGQSRGGGWYCCPCPLTALRSGGGGAPCGARPRGAAGGRDDAGGAWPESAKFYCCRADLVAAMAREHSNNNEHSKGKAMQQQQSQGQDDFDDQGVVVDYDSDSIISFDEVAEEALPDETFREVFDRSHQDDRDERWQIVEPDLPYVENLPHQLDIGRVIVITGVVLPDAIGFSVNLACGAGDTPDLAFHLNPRLDRCYVARNSRIKGSWGQEESAALGGSPFKRGEEFVIHILVTATDFKVSVDRMHFCNFQYRMPLSKICRLAIHGDVIVSSIHHTRLDVYPERPLAALPEHTFCTIPTDYAVPWSKDLSNKENLFIGRFKPNLSVGMEVLIRGRMKLLPQSFYVNLQQGCQLWPHPNVHLHLNPRFAAENCEHVVVVNGWMRGSWGSETKYDKCRFRPGELFTVVIYIEEQRYRVTVNGLQQATLDHRASPTLVDTLVVRGDVFINHISIAKSGPPVERLPSPGSPEGSLCGSFVHIPEATSLHTALSSDSHLSESETELESPCSFQQSRPSGHSVHASDAERPIFSAVSSPTEFENENKPACSTLSHLTFSQEACSKQDEIGGSNTPHTAQVLLREGETPESGGTVSSEESPGVEGRL